MNKTKQAAKEFFIKHKLVYNPALKRKVIFGSKGLSHLFYKGANKKSSRSEKETVIRIMLLERAMTVLQRATFFQEESLLKNSSGEPSRYFAFEAVVEGRRIKVIVCQIGKGKPHFWSVIPEWRRVRGEVVNAKGDLLKE
ncbi:hypothetical protein COT49_03290 [candidate division WWE3 bacterium CG08_land_8_20_14_0_20_40_13]|uniref:Uncharacterized protein n=1 Tax=candidate division WWE3 bacterium CG08_land_8_20_14_0_20_40_13 TaxID=1975084 RepID=A0A2H0XD27_UNCKA|nr:MAG: hypothetical protein COT49_03290 [candidate division WWE3 bacterium CG08_land_8_20_14_0_20_40_13]